ncbi:hypothetical protein BCT86_16895 [Vibrio breoganii]|nr:hypothetical protein A1QG_06390 [Vibrio breoganii ZF-29]OEF84428.1 hypothetical protein B003_07185 [Vibrio breoganii 1C10]PMG93296.1 hypothetical protein BCU80_08690 [Vibrio breoganii]PMG94455.1 hypothetical protein BCU79_11410 [Vibrio breoganii]PMI19798.1 hypothetical protein BCU49_08730 [Vibrio breoganii]
MQGAPLVAGLLRVETEPHQGNLMGFSFACYLLVNEFCSPINNDGQQQLSKLLKKWISHFE